MINIERRDRIDVLSFSVKSINALVTDEIQDEIMKILDTTGTKLIIDLKGVDYIDSSGFGCFLSLLRRAKIRYGIIKFANANAEITRLIEALYLHTVFEVYKDLDSCISSFR